MTESTRIELTRKPTKCPSCHGKPIATIQYGYPNFSAELTRRIEDGEIRLGGCCIDTDNPAWECTVCGQKIHKRMSKQAIE